MDSTQQLVAFEWRTYVPCETEGSQPCFAVHAQSAGDALRARAQSTERGKEICPFFFRFSFLNDEFACFYGKWKWKKNILKNTFRFLSFIFNRRESRKLRWWKWSAWSVKPWRNLEGRCVFHATLKSFPAWGYFFKSAYPFLSLRVQHLQHLSVNLRNSIAELFCRLVFFSASWRQNSSVKRKPVQPRTTSM